jgi:fumarate hydratase, class II
VTDSKGRIERDTMGAMEVPAEALYGAQTARAVVNFPISGWRLPATFLGVLARIKGTYAEANRERGLLSGELAGAIVAAAEEVARGGMAEQFPLDVFQTGSGTSTNMNMNEVLAHLADRRLAQDAAGSAGPEPEGKLRVHPNDHVNMGQSSNDVIPAAVRVAAALAWRDHLRPALEAVVVELRRLAVAHARTVTLGRTHLMDAVPTTYGRILDGWAKRLEQAIARAAASADGLRQLPLGGTAVGTGVGADPAAVRRAVELLGVGLNLPLEAEANPAVGMAGQDAPVAHADALAGVGRVLLSIANDLRLRASGPFGGLGELRLPAVQPGSSIMPGKVNPVIPEAVVQVAIEVEGLAAACRATTTLQQLDLSHALPLLAWNLDTMTHLLTGASRTLVDRCLQGLEVDRDRSRELASRSPAMATALAGRIGYERAAEVAKAAEKAGESVAVAARRMQVLPVEELDELLDLDRLAGVVK